MVKRIRRVILPYCVTLLWLMIGLNRHHGCARARSANPSSAAETGGARMKNDHDLHDRRFGFGIATAKKSIQEYYSKEALRQRQDERERSRSTTVHGSRHSHSDSSRATEKNQGETQTTRTEGRFFSENSGGFGVEWGEGPFLYSINNKEGFEFSGREDDRERESFDFQIDFGEAKSGRDPLVSKTHNDTSVQTTYLKKQLVVAQRRVQAMTMSMTDTTRRHPKHSNSLLQGAELTIQLDPASLSRLAILLGQSSLGIGHTFVATLRFLAPMIVARRCLTWLGFLFYDHYTGRYLRTAYTKRLRNARRYDLPAACRGIARMGIQLSIMATAGKFVQHVFSSLLSGAPSQLFGWLLSGLWLSAVHLASSWIEPLISRYSFLSIQVTGTTEFQSPTRILTRPWHILQWMRDPEEWINSIATYNEQMRNRNRSFQPDPLLFPSTWKPLKLFTALAVFRVVTAHGMESACGCLIMRQYILHLVAYDEWYRILMREKRIALASFVHTASFLAACCQLSTAVFSQSRLAPTLLAPVLLASLFSWWMNIVIYWDRVAAKDRRRQNHQSTDRLSAPGEEGIGEKYYTGAEKQILQFL